MAILITAIEARALSSPDSDIDRHIEHINQQIQYAAKDRFYTIELELDDCNYNMALKIAQRLRSVGYEIKWYMIDCRRAWFILNWGES